MFCPQCGSNLAEGATFCGNCGHRLGAQAAAPQPVAAGQQAAVQQPAVQQPAASPAPWGQAPARPAPAPAPAPRKSRKAPFIAAAIAAVVLIAAVVAVVVVVPGLVKDEAIYVPTKVTTYHTDQGEDGVKETVVKYKYDDEGNQKETTTDYYSSHFSFGKLESNEKSGRTVQTFKQDANGLLEKLTSVSKTTSGEVTEESTAEYDSRVEDGRQVSQESESTKLSYWVDDQDPLETTGEMSTQYDYYPSGRLKSSSNEWSNRAPDTSGFSSYEQDSASDEVKYVRFEGNSLTEYGEDGYIRHSESETTRHYEDESREDSTTESSYDYEWEFDADGAPVACTVTVERSDDDGSEYDFTFDIDDAGNITALYNSEGKLIAEYEYQKIEHPSDYIKSHRVKTVNFVFR